jgi:transposase-like protein
LAEHQTGKRRCVVAMRERGGRTLPFVVITEDQAVPLVRQVVEHGSTVYADEASSWDALHAFYDARRVNHSIAFHDEGVSTNWAESFFSRLRRRDWPTPPDRRSPAPVRGRDGVARGQPAQA